MQAGRLARIARIQKRRAASFFAPSIRVLLKVGFGGNLGKYRRSSARMQRKWKSVQARSLTAWANLKVLVNREGLPRKIGHGPGWRPAAPVSRSRTDPTVGIGESSHARQCECRAGHFQVAADDLAQVPLRWGAQIAAMITNGYSWDQFTGLMEQHQFNAVKDLIGATGALSTRKG
jgi:hypothetical protein